MSEDKHKISFVVRASLAVLILVCSFSFCSCNSLKNDDEYSYIPWNQPADWESAGRFGNVIPQNR